MALQTIAYTRRSSVRRLSIIKDHTRALHIAQKSSGVVETQKDVDICKASVYLDITDIEQNYTRWKEQILSDPKKRPYCEQEYVLEAVHEACLADARAETQGLLFPEPLLRLIHGLPGSGKSQLLLWLRSYFEEVHQWIHEVHFVFLAPLNSMAAGIDGLTVHSWGNVAFVDRRGVEIKSRADEPETMAIKAAKNSKLRFVLIDEIEAAGVKLLGELVESVKEGKRMPLAYGGVHFLFFGDFWQLPPVGEIAIMQNPCHTLNQATPSLIVNTFWMQQASTGIYPLQEWPGFDENPPRVLELLVNKRSGKDTWFSAVLDACRLGNLSLENYCFLHGFPTMHCGSTVSPDDEIPTQSKTSLCNNARCKDSCTRAISALRKIEPKSFDGVDFWSDMRKDECETCTRERLRRRRVLQCQQYGGLSDPDAIKILTSVRFAECNFHLQWV